MMNLLSVLQTDRFTPWFYIAAATDNMSLQKARVFEEYLLDKKWMRSSCRSLEVGKYNFTCYCSCILAHDKIQTASGISFAPSYISCDGFEVTPELAKTYQISYCDSFQWYWDLFSSLCVIAFTSKLQENCLLL